MRLIGIGATRGTDVDRGRWGKWLGLEPTINRPSWRKELQLGQDAPIQKNNLRPINSSTKANKQSEGGNQTIQGRQPSASSQANLLKKWLHWCFSCRCPAPLATKQWQRQGGSNATTAGVDVLLFSRWSVVVIDLLLPTLISSALEDNNRASQQLLLVWPFNQRSTSSLTNDPKCWLLLLIYNFWSILRKLIMLYIAIRSCLSSFAQVQLVALLTQSRQKEC